MTPFCILIIMCWLWVYSFRSYMYVLQYQKGGWDVNLQCHHIVTIRCGFATADLSTEMLQIFCFGKSTTKFLLILDQVTPISGHAKQCIERVINKIYSVSRDTTEQLWTFSCLFSNCFINIGVVSLKWCNLAGAASCCSPWAWPAQHPSLCLGAQLHYIIVQYQIYNIPLQVIP